MIVNWWALTEQILSSNHITKFHCPGAVMGPLGLSTLAADEMLAIIHDISDDKFNKNIMLK